MIHWAKTGQKEHTYDDLIHAIGKQKFSGIGYALGCVQNVLEELSRMTKRDIPPLNSLCKKAETKVPAKGFEFVSSKYNSLKDNEGRLK